MFYVLVFYVFAQFTWWWYLIFKLNHALVPDEEFYTRIIWMITGEGLVFFILLMIGIVAVRNAFKRQVNLAKREENFLLSVSHELKTPIASVQLFLQTLQKHNHLTNEEQQKIYSNALKEVNRLDSIVSNILAARQIESGESTLQKENIQLDDFINKRIDILKSTLAKNHVILLNLDSIETYIDKLSFESILTNLIENSVKYSPKGSEIKVNLKSKESCFILSISDNGMGISDEEKKHIFNKFYRVQSDLTRHTKGTGLGLFIIKHLVNSHQGSIQLSDNNPKGLIVKISIPIIKTNTHE
jgi:signal transduction histidine kinase